MDISWCSLSEMRYSAILCVTNPVCIQQKAPQSDASIDSGKSELKSAHIFIRSYWSMCGLHYWWPRAGCIAGHTSKIKGITDTIGFCVSASLVGKEWCTLLWWTNSIKATSNYKGIGIIIPVGDHCYPRHNLTLDPMGWPSSGNDFFRIRLRVTELPSTCYATVILWHEWQIKTALYFM